MKKKTEYEGVKIEILLFEQADIVTASGDEYYSEEKVDYNAWNNKGGGNW